MGISSQVLALGVVAVIFGAVLFWIFVGPQRAKKQRRDALNAQGGYFKTWDPDITSRKRSF